MISEYVKYFYRVINLKRFEFLKIQDLERYSIDELIRWNIDGIINKYIYLSNIVYLS